MKRITKFLYCLVGLLLMAYAFASYDLLFWGRVPAWVTPYMLVYAMIAGFLITALIGFWLFAKGLLSRRRLPVLADEREGGRVSISAKALRNITYTTVERFDGILEDRVKVRILHGKSPCYNVKIWLGIAEYSALPARHDAIRSAVAQALLDCTGVPVRRVDLIFYTAHTKSAHNPESEGGTPQ